MNINPPYILDILCNYLHASRQGEIVNFFWIPSHIGIHGNSKADSAAKSAVQFEIIQNWNILLSFIWILLIGRYFVTFVIRVNFTLFKIR